MLLVVQVLIVALGQLRVEHAAREAGRVAAVDPDPAVAQRAAGRSLDPARTEVQVQRRAESVSVTVSYRLATDVPIVGRFVGDLSLAAASTFRVEWQQGDRAPRRRTGRRPP